MSRRPGDDERPVLHLVVCAAGVAPGAPGLAHAAAEQGWDVWAVPTPAALEFVSTEELALATGHTVRAQWRRPGQPGSLPRSHATVVAPATYNTINKWAAGVADTYALGQLADALGRRVPVVVLPCVDDSLASTSAYRRSVAALRADGVRVLDGTPDEAGAVRGLAPQPAGGPGATAADFPWRDALDVLGAPR